MSTSTLYDNYNDFKGWSEQAILQSTSTYEAIFGPMDGAKNARLLEIGFGDGAFLDWAKSAGHHITGLEIRDSAIATARGRGHEAFRKLPGEFEPVDAVFAIDVLEHMSLQELGEFFTMVTAILKPGGKLIARFPNASSPFFGHFQHGDATHRTPLNAMSVSQIAALHDLELTGARNFRPRPPEGVKGLKLRAAYALRNLFETVFGIAYFGQRVSMDPNLLVDFVRR